MGPKKSVKIRPDVLSIIFDLYACRNAFHVTVIFHFSFYLFHPKNTLFGPSKSSNSATGPKKTLKCMQTFFLYFFDLYASRNAEFVGRKSRTDKRTDGWTDGRTNT